MCCGQNNRRLSASTNHRSANAFCHSFDQTANTPCDQAHASGVAYWAVGGSIARRRDRLLRHRALIVRIETRTETHRSCSRSFAGRTHRGFARRGNRWTSAIRMRPAMGNRPSGWFWRRQHSANNGFIRRRLESSDELSLIVRVVRTRQRCLTHLVARIRRTRQQLARFGERVEPKRGEGLVRNREAMVAFSCGHQPADPEPTRRRLESNDELSLVVRALRGSSKKPTRLVASSQFCCKDPQQGK